MLEPKRDFFSVVGHLAQRRHPEDQLSNTFRACFSYSQAYREAVLACLWKLCRLRGRPPAADSWQCTTQVTPTTSAEGSRYDIHLVDAAAKASGSTRVPAFVLESKVDAPLTKAQLKKYALSTQRDGHFLVALTKHYPNVALSWMKNRGIASLRWQDICRVLLRSTLHSPLDKFLTSQFLEYLEAADMAYDDVSLADLERFATLLNAVRDGKQGGQVNYISFHTGDACLSLLGDVLRGVRESLKTGVQWKRWGPGYYSEEDNGEYWHTLGFNLWRKTKTLHVSIHCGFTFPGDPDEDIYFATYFWNDKTKKYHMKPGFYEPVGRFCDREKKIDRDRLLKRALAHLRQWNLVT